MAGLIKKQRGFTEEEKQQVLDVQREILAKIIPLHCQLHQQGNLELTCSPYFHPILPLLCDNAAAKVSNPMDPVPEPPFAFPEEAEWHIQEVIQAFDRIMGCRPAVMWPSEGSVSDEACGLMAKAGMPFFAPTKASCSAPASSKPEKNPAGMNCTGCTGCKRRTGKSTACSGIDCRI